MWARALVVWSDPGLWQVGGPGCGVLSVHLTLTDGAAPRSPHGVDERGGRLGRVQTDVSVVVTHPAACLYFLGSVVSFGFRGNN